MHLYLKDKNRQEIVLIPYNFNYFLIKDYITKVTSTDLRTENLNLCEHLLLYDSANRS